jgi:GNAT superfamily N-acetyltransferase
MPENIRLRTATSEDRDFLVDMAVLAVNWLPERRLTRQEILDTPELSHYVDGWMRPDDRGIIALTPEGAPVGAAWLRQLPATDPGYGFVADDVPELSIAVVPGSRGGGVGRALIRALLAEAETVGLRAVSLSVERANRAAQWYRDEGFVVVQSFDDADTMLWTP